MHSPKSLLPDYLTQPVRVRLGEDSAKGPFKVRVRRKGMPSRRFRGRSFSTVCGNVGFADWTAGAVSVASSTFADAADS
jgi:hypothetical protein